MADQAPPTKIIAQQRFVSGIADFPKEGLDTSVYQAGQSIDHRHDPRAITLLPRTVKESGSIVTDLPLWGSTIPTSIDTYIYGNTGNLYKRTTAPVYTLISQIPSSHGNGLFYYPEDDYLYGTSDSTIFRYGQISLGNPQLTNNWLQAAGGVPTNTNSLQLLSASSQYGHAADSATLSVTSDLSIGAWIKPTSLPTVGNTMTLVGKWDESATKRSYKFGIGAVSGYFGTGADSALTITTNTTETPIDSACTGTIGTQTLSATNSSFVAGQQILIHQTQATLATGGVGTVIPCGTFQRTKIQSYTAGTITTVDPLNATYLVGAQVRVVPQYTDVTINTGVTYTAKQWDRATGTGGILAFMCNGTLTVTGHLSAQGRGFFGGSPNYVGEEFIINSYNQGSGNTNTDAGGAAGGGAAGGGGGGAGGNQKGGDGGVGNSFGMNGADGTQGTLTTLLFGAGGGGGGRNNGADVSGGAGGGIILAIAPTIAIAGGVSANGSDGLYTLNSGNPYVSGGGGGSGDVAFFAQTVDFGTSIVTASGGGGNANLGGYYGGTGGAGRVYLDYLTSYTGTTTPTVNAVQDSSLVTSTTYTLQLNISANGTTFDTLTQNVPLTLSTWQQVAVSWKASTSMATFYLNAVSQGTATGTRTAIHDNTSLLYVGANMGAASIGNYYNGLLDDPMILSSTEDATFWQSTLAQQIATNTAFLQAFYKMNGNGNDATANANNLTFVNSPVFVTDVPYPGATTRLDIDQTQVGTGNTYTTPTAVIFDATDELPFTPQRDPQKSIQVNIAAVGTGNWTVGIYNTNNILVTSVTVANAQLHTGLYEFVFPTPWRVLTNFENSYFATFTSTVADGTISTGTSSNLSTAGYTTYFSFLVTDTQCHPISQMLNQMVIGNERYVATFNGLPSSYNPNTLVLPAAWRVRCFALWNEYLAIGCMRGQAITDFDQGRIYFWDGSALTFNFFIDVPEGGVNALLSKGASLYAWAGYTGYLFQYQTGLEGDKIKRVPYILEADTCEIFPGAVTTWRNLLRFGVGGSVNSSTINRGVYSWGSFLTYGFFQQLYRDSLSFDYPVSTGNTGSTVSIGLALPVQNQLLIGWQDGVAFGVDNVSFNNPYASVGSISLLLADDGEAYKQKASLTLVAQHLPLQTGESIQVGVATDRGAFQLSGYNTTVGATKTAIVIPGSLYNEYQTQTFLATATGATTPSVISIAFERDVATGALKLQTT